MKHLKQYESIKKDIQQLEIDIKYLTNMSSGYRDYIMKTIDYYKLTEEQIHNLKLAVEYNYLDRHDYSNVINEIINSNDVWHSLTSERKFKDAYETNFKTKIIDLPKPYQIACTNRFANNLHPYLSKNIEDIHSLNTHSLFDVIGKIPGYTYITKFETKYLVGIGRYKNEQDNKTLWERYQNTKRESEFIKIYNESDLYILTEKDIEYIETKEIANKYNI